jgi:hypothetical protein
MLLGIQAAVAHARRRFSNSFLRCIFLSDESIDKEINLMCRNIKTLHNFKPPATDEEIRASALQFVRKLSGFTRPAKANEVAFSHAVDRVTEAAHELLESLVTNAPPRDREIEAAKARARSADRFRSAIAEQAS